jgi:hypothetical protein
MDVLDGAEDIRVVSPTLLAKVEENSLRGT